MQEHSKHRRSQLVFCVAALVLCVGIPGPTCSAHAADVAPEPAGGSERSTEFGGIAGANAEPSPATPQPSGYAEAIEAALYAHERGQYEEAREHFRRAHELHPNARTLRGLGKVEFELRNYGEAKQHLQAALQSTVKPLDVALREETEALLRRAETFVGEVRVEVDPQGAVVAIDGVPSAYPPRGVLNLLTGDHVLEFRAEGRLSERRMLHIRGGDQKTLSIVLSPAPAELVSMQTVVPRATSARPDEHPPLYKKWWLWTVVGVVAAGAAVGIAVATTRQDEPGAVSGGTTGVVLGP